MPSFETPSLQHFASIRRAHTFTEAMLFAALAFLGLKSPFHHVTSFTLLQLYGKFAYLTECDGTQQFSSL